MLTTTELFAEAQRLSTKLDQGLAELRKQGIALAEAEQTYRRSKGTAWVLVLDALPKGTVPEREAWVNARTADDRFARDLADATRQSALEAVRSRRTQLSVLQSMAAAERAEAEFSRTGIAA